MPYADQEDARLYYEVHGSGPVVLCPGGWGILTGEDHGRLPSALRTHFTTIVFDHRGFGQSTDSGRALTTVDIADDAAAVLRAGGVGKAHVFGHGGLGACLSQHLAARNPELIDKLALMAGWAGPDPHKHTQAKIFVELLRHAGFKAFRDYGAILIHAPEYFNAHVDEILSDHGPWHHFSKTPEDLLRIVEATIEHDARAVLKDITAPTLVIHSEFDLIDPPRLGVEMSSSIPNATQYVLKGATHAYATNSEAVAALNDRLASFFQ